MEDERLPKIVVVLGPTASGKTDLGIFLAKKFNGEIISADSRQIYRGMNIGTAKPNRNVISSVEREISTGKRNGDSSGESLGMTIDQPTLASLTLRRSGPTPPKRGVAPRNDSEYVVDGVAHHLIDVVNPDEEFTVGDFKKMAEEKIADILKRGKLPIVVGGTGLYIWALVDNLEIPKKAADEKMRARLNATPLAELLKMLKEKDPDSYDNIDLKNPRRVIRALEVAMSGESFWQKRRVGKRLYDALQIGLKWPREVLYERINGRVDKQIEQGLVEEVKKLAQDLTPACHAKDGKPPVVPLGKGDRPKLGVWELPSMSGIGYRQFKEHLDGKETLEEAVEKLKRDTRRYAKRQETWFRRDKRIKWIEGGDRKEVEKLIGNFISYNL